MTSPEEALAQARASAAAMRDRGAYPPETSEMAPLQTEPVTYERLLEWAAIEPEVRNVRSTRRWGAPITTLKRVLLRLLAQYHAELIAEQARVNVNLVRYVRALEEREAALAERVAELEREVQGRGA